MTTMPFRSVLEGTTPSRHASVRTALRLLHEGEPALGALQDDLAAGLQDGAPRRLRGPPNPPPLRHGCFAL